MNKNLFGTKRGALAPAADAVNEAGGVAYAMSPEHALAQYTATGCFNNTFYATAEEQLDKVLELCKKIKPEFIAKTAVWCREEGYMKDMPAFLVAYLTTVDVDLVKKIFGRVINNGKMLRNFVQIMRSGVVGRKSLGSAPRNLVRQWFESRDEDAIFKQSIGNDPSFADILRMVHPTPKDKSMESLYGYLLGLKVVDKKSEMEKDKNGRYTTVLFKDLPGIIKEYEGYKRAKAKGEATVGVPDVPFQMLDSLGLSTEEWTGIAQNAPWHMTRMNLNTFKRHGVLDNKAMVKVIAERLRNEQAVMKAKVFPYQLLAAYLNVNEDMPSQVTDALQDAMEIAIKNIPVIDGNVVICPDVSGSMGSPITGHRKGSTTKMRCIDIAGLMTAALLRSNPSARVIPFEGDVVPIGKLRLNSRDSVVTNASKLASIGGGSTNCSAPLHLLVRENAKVDAVIFVSDNESWIDSANQSTPSYGWGRRGTSTMEAWNALRAKNPKAKLVCIDVQPNGTTQAVERADILNVGGFSDNVFEIVGQFVNGTLFDGHWVKVIQDVKL
jgi:60 kDa SS-A/Ro ribonucleoprotein